MVTRDELREELAKAYFRQYQIHYLNYPPDLPGLREELDRRWITMPHQFEDQMADAAIRVFITAGGVLLADDQTPPISNVQREADWKRVKPLKEEV